MVYSQCMAFVILIETNFSHVYCSFPVDYIISVYMMTNLNSYTLCDLFA